MTQIGNVEKGQSTSVFTEIFRENRWQGRSKSGPGSSLEATAPLRAELPSVFSSLGIKTLIDAPCGTAEWILEVTEDIDYYIGCDVVEEIVWSSAHENKRRNHFFTVADVTYSILPKSDAILCRDCLVHFPIDLAMKSIANFKKSGTRYLFSTTFPSVMKNNDSRLGGWRPLNLERSPFNFPPPERIIRDRVKRENDPYHDKSIGVWNLESIQ